MDRKTQHCSIKCVFQHSSYPYSLEKMISQKILGDTEKMKELSRNFIFDMEDKGKLARLIHLKRLENGIKGAISGEMITCSKTDDLEALKEKTSYPEYVQIHNDFEYIVDKHVYFLIKDNNVAYVSYPGGSQSILEKYFTYLLSEKVDLIPEITTEKGVSLKSIKSVHLSIYDRSNPLGSMIVDQDKKKISSNTYIAVLSALGASEEDIKDFSNQGLFEKIIMKLGFSPSGGMKRMEVGKLLKYIPEEDMTYIGPDGKEHKGLLTLSMKRQIARKPPKYLHPDDQSVQKEMIFALREWEKSGKIKLAPSRC